MTEIQQWVREQNGKWAMGYVIQGVSPDNEKLPRNIRTLMRKRIARDERSVRKLLSLSRIPFSGVQNGEPVRHLVDDM